MSRFLNAATTMQTLSLAAMEEASRQGRTEADIEHLLLALTLTHQPAGGVLRSMGVTLDAARVAVDAQHSAQLGALGIRVDQGGPGRIVFHETSGYDWTDRANAIVGRSTEGAGKGTASDVLRGLLAEPSGLITEILARLDTTPDDVLARLDEADNAPAPAPKRAAPGDAFSQRFEAFIPAPIEDVWDLLADTERMPQWCPLFATVEPTADDGVWVGHAPTQRPDGKPIKTKEKYRSRVIEAIESAAPSRLVWRMEHTDAPRSVLNPLEIDLAPAPGGTQVQISTSWPRRTGWRRITSFVMRPATRFLIWVTLLQIGSGISRSFR